MFDLFVKNESACFIIRAPLRWRGDCSVVHRSHAQRFLPWLPSDVWSRALLSEPGRRRRRKKKKEKKKWRMGWEVGMERRLFMRFSSRSVEYCFWIVNFCFTLEAKSMCDDLRTHGNTLGILPVGERRHRLDTSCSHHSLWIVTCATEA